MAVDQLAENTGQGCALPCSVMSDSLRPLDLCPWDSPGKNTGVGSHALLQGIFPTQGSNPRLLCLLHHLLCLLHGRQIIYHCATWEAIF